MTVEAFKLPDVGEGVAEGELVRWLVAPGDAVTEDQPVAEVETDKSLVEVPSPYDGTVRELRFEEGDVVPVGEVLLTFDVPGEDDPEAEAGGEPRAATGDPEGGDAAGNERVAAGAGTDADDAGRDVEPEPAPEPDPGQEREQEQKQEQDASDADTTTAGGVDEPVAPGRVFAPPSVRRLARELGVDLTALDGAGPGGRVTEADVRRAADTAGDEDGGDGDGDAEQAGENAAGPSPRSVEFPGRSAVSRRADGEAGDGQSVPSGAVVPAGRDRTLAAPATRRVARELGVELNDVPAVEEREEGAFVDEAAVRAYAQAHDSGAETAGTPAPAATAADDAPDPRTPSLSDAEPAVSTAEGDLGTARAPSEPATAEAGDGSAAAPDADPGTDADADADAGVAHSEPTDRTDPGEVPGERIPYRGVRRATGEAMQRSAFTAPHVTHTDVADVESLVDLRAELKSLAAERDVRLTYLPFVMKACVVALQEYPIVNAVLDEAAGEIVLRDDYHVGVATATEAGLLVPVVRNVDRKGLATIAADTNELVAQARDRSIDRADLRGSTFTVTNVGTIGGEFATPILNAPEAAILALGAIKRRPHVADGEVVARHTLPLSLSFDHRVFDGATAAEFTNRVIDLLEEPRRLLL